MNSEMRMIAEMFTLMTEQEVREYILNNLEKVGAEDIHLVAYQVWNATNVLPTEAIIDIKN